MLKEIAQLTVVVLFLVYIAYRNRKIWDIGALSFLLACAIDISLIFAGMTVVAAIVGGAHASH